MPATPQHPCSRQQHRQVSSACHKAPTVQTAPHARDTLPAGRAPSRTSAPSAVGGGAWSGGICWTSVLCRRLLLLLLSRWTMFVVLCRRHLLYKGPLCTHQIVALKAPSLVALAKPSSCPKRATRDCFRDRIQIILQVAHQWVVMGWVCDRVSAAAAAAAAADDDDGDVLAAVVVGSLVSQTCICCKCA